MRTIDIELNGYRLTITEATVLQGMRRSILQDNEDTQTEDTDDDALIYLKRLFYPDLMSVVTSQAGFDHWPLTFKEFIELVPDDLAVKWENATYELNPNWRRKGDDQTPEEKKASTSGSLDGNSEALSLKAEKTSRKTTQKS